MVLINFIRSIVLIAEFRMLDFGCNGKGYAVFVGKCKGQLTGIWSPIFRVCLIPVIIKYNLSDPKNYSAALRDR